MSLTENGISVGITDSQALDNEGNGAEEGTRTPTPLRVHGPEPCASANSATSALGMRRTTARRNERSDIDYFTRTGGQDNNLDNRQSWRECKIGSPGNRVIGKAKRLATKIFFAFSVPSRSLLMVSFPPCLFLHCLCPVHCYRSNSSAAARFSSPFLCDLRDLCG